MVARKHKWRFHCATCGEAFAGPQTWAYCSKDCERNRTGRTDPPPMPDAAVDRYLDLAQRLEDAMPWDREQLQQRMARLQLEKEDQVTRELHSSDRLPQTVAEFWIHPVRREADKFEASARRLLSVAVRLGQRLIEAREALPAGEFGRLFSDHENAVHGACWFGSSWARKLMAIARHPVVSDRSHANALPADVESCYLLTRLPEAELTEAMERGLVHGQMRREQIKALLPAPAHDEVAESDPLDRLLERVRVPLGLFAADHPDRFGELRERLAAILRAFEREVVHGGAS